MEVLLIDDEPHLGELVERKLTKSDPDVHVEQQWNCDTGITRLRDRKFDIVLLDQKFVSGVTGLECLRRLRELFPDLPVVMLTGYPTDDLMEECMKSGADDYVKKELIDVLLTQVVWSATKRRQAKPMIAARAQARKKELDDIV